MKRSLVRMRVGALATVFGLMLAATLCSAQGADDGVLLGGYPADRAVAAATGRYFVAFYTAPGQEERDMLQGHGAQLRHSYSLVPVVAVQVDDEAALEAIRQDPRVHYVEADNVVYALGDAGDPEVDESATPGDQSPAGNATQDILKAWVLQPDVEHLLFSIQVQSLTGTNPETGDGFPVNGIWKFVFTLQKSGSAVTDLYFVEMRKGEVGAPTFNWGYVDGSLSTTVGPVDAGRVLVEAGIIEILISNASFAGAPNGNAAPAPGDVLGAPFAQTQQLAGASELGGLLVAIDRAPNSGGGRSFTLQNVLSAFSVQPIRLDFGSQAAGTTRTLAAVVTNSSTDQTLVIGSVSSSNSAFSVSPTSATLPPGSSQSFDVSFSPSVSGPFVGSIVFDHNAVGSPASVPVLGSAFSAADGEDVPWGITAVNAPQVWSRSKGGTIKVAILDTGIDPLHFDLDARFRGGFNFVTNTAEPRDGHGHGTHVAGTVGAELNGLGVVGVAPEVEIYALKVLSDAGSGFESDILAAIDWSVQNGMHVASMSLGGRVPSTTALAAYDAANAAGLLCIAAAGNGVEGVGTPVINFPAGYPSVMAIGAVDMTLQKAQFSDFGPGLDLVAPGVDVRSTYPRGTGREARVSHEGTRLDANPIEFAASTTSTGITALAIDAGLGLTPADFPPASAGNIVLVQRGGTTFADKVRAAQDAGAVAVIIYNNAAGNFNGTLGTARDDVRDRDWVAAVSLSQADGQALVAAGSPTITVFHGSSDFAKLSGTSMACPHVSGVAALVFAADPQLSNEQVRTILVETATDLGTPGWDPLFGYGLVDADAAVGRVPQPPVITHLDCDDPSVSRKGGWHRVDDERATHGHYCRNVGAGNENTYLEFAYSGSLLEMQMARGPRGGRAEVRIDGVSRGMVDFYRPPADPNKPDQTGKKDLTFGETAAFETAAGEHVFRLNMVNDSPDPKRNMIYIDGFVIHEGQSEGDGNPTETSGSSVGTVAGLTNLLTGSAQVVTAAANTILMTAVLETAGSGDLDLYVLDPQGGLVAQSASAGGPEVLRWVPQAAGTYRVVAVNRQPTAAAYTLYSIDTRVHAAAPVAKAGAPSRTYRLEPNAPNPFNPSTRIAYAVPRSGPVRLAVYDAAGRLVRVLVDDIHAPGEHAVTWNGSSERGRSMPSGVYFYELRAGAEVQRRKMLLLK